MASQAETPWRARALRPERLRCGPETWHCLEGVAEMSALCRGGEGKCSRTLFCRTWGSIEGLRQRVASVGLCVRCFWWPWGEWVEERVWLEGYLRVVERVQGRGGWNLAGEGRKKVV